MSVPGLSWCILASLLIFMQVMAPGWIVSDFIDLLLAPHLYLTQIMNLTFRFLHLNTV